MMQKLLRVVTMLSLLALFGCEQPVKWTLKQEIEPDPVKIGQTVTARCTVTGEPKQIGWMTAAPLIAPEITIELRDDGTEGDKKAGDAVFTAKGDVPVEAEPGMYELEVIAYDKNGDILRLPSFTILDKDGKVIKEVKPEEGDEDQTVEASTIIEVELVE